MDKRKSIKTAAAVLTAVALCVSSVAAYQRLGNTYVPSDQKRDLQTNQVLFPEDKDTQNSDSGTQEMKALTGKKTRAPMRRVVRRIRSVQIIFLKISRYPMRKTRIR